MATRPRLLRGIAMACAALAAVGLAVLAAREPLQRAIQGSALDTQLRLLKRHLAALERDPVRCVRRVEGVRPLPVVLVAVDTLRADALGFLGRRERDVSPRLDALAEDSLVFEHAIAPAPWTTPSFAAVFTGLAPGALGLAEEAAPLPRAARTLPEALCDAGFRTAGVVSHTYVGGRYGFDRGFERWDETHAGGHAHVSSPDVTDSALAVLDQLAAGDDPFLLFVHYFDPHFDYVEHEAFAFGGAAASDVRSERDNIVELRALARDGALGPADLRALVDRYHSEIAFTDHHVGRLLDDLRRRGIYDRALVIFLADHGEMFAEREDRWIGHTRHVYQSVVHVPLLLKLPDPAVLPDAALPLLRARRGRIAQPVTTADVAATVLQILAHPEPLPGRSLLAPPAGPVFSQTRQGARRDAVVDGRWKLVRHRDGGGASELYDLRSDPEERRDLASKEPERVAALERTLSGWLADLDEQARRFVPEPSPVLSPAERERLRALGYLEDATP